MNVKRFKSDQSYLERFSSGDIRTLGTYSKALKAFEKCVLDTLAPHKGDPWLELIKSKLSSGAFIPIDSSNNLSHLVSSKGLLQMREFDKLKQYEEMLSWSPPLLARGFWIIADFSIQLHFIVELMDRPDFLEYWEEIKKVYPLSNLEEEGEKIQGQNSSGFVFLPYQTALAVLDEKSPLSEQTKQELEQFLTLLSDIWENKPYAERSKISFERFSVNISQETNAYAIKEAFKKYLIQKIDFLPADPSLDEMKTQLQSSFTISQKRLEELAYLVHLTSEERMSLYSFMKQPTKAHNLSSELFAKGFWMLTDKGVQWDLAKDPALRSKLCIPSELEMMEQDLASISNSSIFKKYLVNSGALLPKGGVSKESEQNIHYALQVLSRVLKIDLEESSSYDLRTWNEKTSTTLYTRFLNLLEAGTDAKFKEQFLRINRRKSSYEKKIEETLALLDNLTGAPGIQKLKNALSIQVEQKDLGDFPGVELTWNPNHPLLEQREKSFNDLYLATFLEISHKRGIQINPYAIHLAQERGDFSGLKDALVQMPKLGERVRSKVISFYSELEMNPDSEISTYDLFVSFKHLFKERYLAVRGKLEQDPIRAFLAEEAYLSQNIKQLSEMQKELLPQVPTEEVVLLSSSSPATTIEESSSVAANEVPSPEKPVSHFIENLKTIRDWIDQNKTSIFGHFVFEKRLLACKGDESQLLEIVDFAIQSYTEQLKAEALMMKEPCLDAFGSLEELEKLSNELAYKKFLKGLNMAKKKYGSSPALDKLEEISNCNIPIQEKRTLSIVILDKTPSEPHLEKLLQCLVSLFSGASSQSISKINLEAFSSQKTKKAAFKWLSESSFLKSLEVEIGTKDHPKIEDALMVFREKIKNQVEVLDLPPIYLDLLDHRMMTGSVEGLKQLAAEIAYQRYMQAITTIDCEKEKQTLASLLELDAELRNSSAFELVKKCKMEAFNTVKDKWLLNYLLFQLEQFPFNRRAVSEAIPDLICEYLQESPTPRPFDLYLQQNQFSWVHYDEESCDWFVYLYEQFTQQLIKEAQISKYTTTQLLALELENLEPFHLAKLDLLAYLIRSPETVTIQDLYRYCFTWSIKQALANPQCERNHQRNFGEVQDIARQVGLLDALSKDLALSGLVHSTIFNGNLRNLEIGYEFLKDVMGGPSMKGSKEIFDSFLAVHFLGYSDDLTRLVSKEAEEEDKKLKELEDLMKGELSNSALRKLLEDERIIDVEGDCKGIFSLMPLQKIETYIRSIKTFVEFNCGHKNPSPYSRSDSWITTLRNLNLLLEQVKDSREYISCWGTEVDELIAKDLRVESSGSFSTVLRTLNIHQMSGMCTDEYFQGYLRWEGKVFKYFEEKIGSFEKKKNDLLRLFENKNDRRVPAFEKAVATFINIESLQDALKNLKKGIEHRDWEAVNENADKIIYVEYRIALVDSIVSGYKGKNTDALRSQLIQISQEIEGNTNQKIKHALQNLPKFLSSQDKAKLVSILNNQAWIVKLEESIRLKWNWVQTKSYLMNFQDIHLSPQKLTLYEKQAILDNLFYALSESLLKEVTDLEMDEMYRHLIKRAHYENALFIWDLLVEEVFYQKYLFKIQEAKDKGRDMSLFDDLEEITENYTISEKTNLIRRRLEENQAIPAYKEILDGFNQGSVFDINYSSVKQEN